MSHRHLLAFLALAGIVLQPAAAQPPIFGVASSVRFHSQEELFSWVAIERQLGDPADSKLLAKLAAGSRIEHLRDSSSAITVVQLGLRDAHSNSLVRSPEGNYYYYVLRDTADGQLLLGRMYGQGYSSHLNDGSLEFEVKLHRSPQETVHMRFRAGDTALVNLTAPPSRALIAGLESQGRPPAER